MKNKVIILLVMVLALVGCADSSHVQECLPTVEHTYGFWGGTWHGMTSIFQFIGSLIWEDSSVYAVNNNGAWYDFGFVGGLWIMVKGISAFFKVLGAIGRNATIG